MKNQLQTKNNAQLIITFITFSTMFQYFFFFTKKFDKHYKITI